MPRGDMTGPAGYGPMTGRGAGYCAGYPTPGYMRPWGWGGGRRRGRMFHGRRPTVYAHPYGPPYASPYAPPYAPSYAGPYYEYEETDGGKAELRALEVEAKRLTDMLAEIQARIEDLSSGEQTKSEEK